MITSAETVSATADALAPLPAGMAPPLVDVRDLTLRFVSRQADVTLLHGLSFALEEGEVLCVIGEFGIGQEHHHAHADAPAAAERPHRRYDHHWRH